MMKTEIIKAARSLGIEKIGFSKQSVVALFPYYVKGEEGNLSLYARPTDYHLVAEEKLKQLALFLGSLGAKETTVHVDKGTFDDRQAAFEAGLGFFGMNGMLINRDYGSFFFIGQIIHDLELDEDDRNDETCLECGRCERECPGGALLGGKVITAKCLSEITQKRGELSEDEKSLIKSTGTCWGCDICQRVCPHNSGLETTAIPEFLEDRITHLVASDIRHLSNKEFKEKYGKYAFSWRGKNVLLRNLEIYEEE